MTIKQLIFTLFISVWIGIWLYINNNHVDDKYMEWYWHWSCHWAIELTWIKWDCEATVTRTDWKIDVKIKITK